MEFHMYLKRGQGKRGQGGNRELTASVSYLDGLINTFTPNLCQKRTKNLSQNLL